MREISISSKTVSEIHWCINSINNSSYHINNIPNPDITIHTDASLTDWRITNGMLPTRGLQQKEELDHINVLDFAAVETGIYTYCKHERTLHVRVIFYNKTAVAYVNNMGSIKSGTGNNIGNRI